MRIYISKKTGTIYWLDKNVLMFSPILKDIDYLLDLEKDSGEVNFELMKGEKFGEVDAMDFYKKVTTELKK